MRLISDLWLSRKSLAGFVIVGVAWSSYFAQMPAIKAAIGASDGVYGAVMLLASLGALAAIWLAPLTHRLAGRWALPFGGVVMSLGMLGAGLSAEIIAFGIAMTVASIGAGVTDVLANVRVSEIESRSGRHLMNLNHAMFSFTYAGCALATGFMREAGWSPAQVFAVLVVLSLVAGWVMLESRTRALPEEDTTPDAPLPHLLVWGIGVLVLIAFLTEAAAEGWSALHLERTLGGGPAEGALGPALLGLSMGIGRLSGHFLSDRLPTLPFITVASVVAAGGLLLVGAAPTLMMAYLGFALTGLGISVVAPLALALIGRIVPPKARLAAISRASALGYGAFFISPPLMGFTSEALGLRAGFWVVSVLLVLCVAALVPVLAARIAARPQTF
ncbi:MFS transporter [Roseobacter cerasinus]|uniref:MFS transporter n=1 Tax=Roseobacter cerasinus TaxID=2602289 RepID=A0A640VYP7_9RHOB|nr:MFS transporter [Roseobacter cerasinus]GFE51356.1 MFS transporter [Roseobacter cerasinus]